jgi:uncharacterized protein
MNLNPYALQSASYGINTVNSLGAPVKSAAPTADVAGVNKAFEQAISTLSGAGSDVEKVYQTGKRRTLSDIASQSINAGMANTLNLPAASIAYDEANRPGTNVAIAGQKSAILTQLGQTLAGLYGTNVGANTAVTTANIGAQTSMANAQLGAQVDTAQQALQKYIAELNAKTSTTNAELDVEAAKQANIARVLSGGF